MYARAAGIPTMHSTRVIRRCRCATFSDTVSTTTLHTRSGRLPSCMPLRSAPAAISDSQYMKQVCAANRRKPPYFSRTGVVRGHLSRMLGSQHLQLRAGRLPLRRRKSTAYGLPSHQALRACHCTTAHHCHASTQWQAPRDRALASGTRDKCGHASDTPGTFVGVGDVCVYITCGQNTPPLRFIQAGIAPASLIAAWHCTCLAGVA